MKITVVGLLVVMGLYWLLFHAAPLPYSHEYFGLYFHNIHRMMGVGFLVAAGLVAWKWKK